MTWTTQKLGSLCSVKTGKKDVNEGNINGAYPFFTCAEKHTYSDNFSFDCEAILIAGNGAVGQTNYYKGKFEAYQRTYILCDFDGINPQYLLYVLNGSLMNELSSKVLGNTIPYIKKGMLTEFEIPVPPLHTQEIIVKKLDAIFIEIEKAEAATKTNVNNAEALFQNYLTKTFENCSQSCDIKKIIDVADLIDSLHKTPKYADDGFPMVRVTDIKVGELDLSKTKKVDEETFTEFSKRHTPKIGDIVFSRVGSYGVSSIVSTNEKFCLGQNTVFIIPKINSTFLYYFLNSGYAKKQYDELIDGVTQPTISLKSIKSVLIPLPKAEIIQKLIIKFDEIHKQSNLLKKKYINKLQQLESLKKSALQKVVSGDFVKE